MRQTPHVNIIAVPEFLSNKRKSKRQNVDSGQRFTPRSTFFFSFADELKPLAATGTIDESRFGAVTAPEATGSLIVFYNLQVVGCNGEAGFPLKALAGIFAQSADTRTAAASGYVLPAEGDKRDKE